MKKFFCLFLILVLLSFSFAMADETSASSAVNQFISALSFSTDGIVYATNYSEEKDTFTCYVACEGFGAEVNFSLSEGVDSSDSWESLKANFLSMSDTAKTALSALGLADSYFEIILVDDSVEAVDGEEARALLHFINGVLIFDIFDHSPKAYEIEKALISSGHVPQPRVGGVDRFMSAFSNSTDDTVDSFMKYSEERDTITYYETRMGLGTIVNVFVSKDFGTSDFWEGIKDSYVNMSVYARKLRLLFDLADTHFEIILIDDSVEVADGEEPKALLHFVDGVLVYDIFD